MPILEGLTASIRAISWPAEADDPLSLPNFETQARRERYRHLGLECASRGLRYLLLAHHGNDQAEGILGRLVAGYTGSGLEGMKRRAPIPECGGLWGVSEGPNRNQSLEASQTSSAETVDGDSPTSNLNMHTAAAGITIHRPFLLFTKSALRKTCEGLDIQWKEDETNQVLGLTLRNTTRSLFQRQRLPLALQERSLMGLASRKSKLGNRFQRASEDVLSRMHAMAFDPRIGQLTLSLSHEDVSKFSTLPRRPSRRKSGKVDSMSVSPTRSLVNRLAAIVSPRKNIEQDTVSDVANTFIKALKGKGQRRFTGGGVWWRRHADRKLDSQTDLQVWSLCRQPLSRTEQHNPCLWADLSSEGRPSSAEQLQDDNVQPFATWQLLDNRFWLKVEHSTKEPVAARLLDKAALTRFRNSLDKETRKRMHDELHTIAPGDVRFTLPILSDGSGAVLALPTLGYVNPVLRKKLTWEWCYKHIDLSR